MKYIFTATTGVVLHFIQLKAVTEQIVWIYTDTDIL